MEIMQLLTRYEFTKQTFDRDKWKCVICGEPGLDAHHILDRSLWDDGGYYLNNGVTLCPTCHLAAELTNISCELLREKAGITKIILPNHLDEWAKYDKWGNAILPNGNRLKGELFFKENVQKALNIGGVLPLFSPYIKYPKTMHLPWSQSLQNDDRCIETLKYFEGREVVVTEKLDGENTTIYNDFVHTRSTAGSSPHPSRKHILELQKRLAKEIPDGWRVCGENMWAKHSIKYSNLSSYFLVFGIWEEDICMAWDQVVELAEIMSLHTVPVLYRGIWDQQLIANLYKPELQDISEGYVVRVADQFKYHEYKHLAAKFVRPNHVQTSKHWLNDAIVQNQLKDKY